MKVTIAGAGIGGLTAALALHQAGYEVSVYESVSTIQPLGVGINLLPQAAHVLNQLGVLDTLLAQGVATQELSYFNMHGQRIWTEPRGLFAGFDSPQISISRGTLQMTLLLRECANRDASCCLLKSAIKEDWSQLLKWVITVTGGGNSPPCQGHHIYESPPAGRPASSMQSESEIS